MSEEKQSIIWLLLRGIIGLSVLLVALGIGAYFIMNKPEAKKESDHAEQITLVETIPAVPTSQPVSIEVMGQIKPATQTEIKAQVAGEIIFTDPEFLPGGFFKAGQEILRIDPSDYELDVRIKSASLNQAKAALSLEMGKQSIAQDELKILEQTTGRKLENSNLALRKPQYAQAKADVEAATAALDLAELNLKRTTITAPFDAMVQTRNVNLGHRVSTQETLATLVRTDEYWIEISVPVQDLHWLDLPDTQGKGGSKASIYLDGGRGMREGRLIKNTGTLDPQSRLAKLIISISDPLLLHNKTKDAYPLVLDDYVRVVLTGKKLENVFIIPRAYIRDENKIWLEKDGKLIIRPVTIAYEDRNYSYVTDGLVTGNKIITSPIAAPIEDMVVSSAKENKTP